MSNRNIILICAGLVLLLLGVFYFVGSSQNKYSWQLHFDPHSKDPYGTYVLVHLLENYFPESDFEVSEEQLEARLAEEKIQVPTTLILTPPQAYLDSAEIEVVKKFVANGNTVFLSSYYFPRSLLSEMLEDSCAYKGYSSLERTNVFANFNSKRLHQEEPYLFEFKSRYGSTKFQWDYFNPNYTCFDTAYSVLGSFNDGYVNYLSLPYGKGRFLLHTSPVIFTNYHLLRKTGKEYVEKSLAYFPEGDIIWDNRETHLFRPESRTSLSHSPLSYVLGEPGLRWGWFVLLAMLLLYMAFRAKRKQKIIPLLEPNMNTSLEFVESIGSLYYQQQNHRNLALQKMKHFLLYIRRHYHISTHRLDSTLIKNISIKAKVPQEEVERIFRTYNTIEKSNTIEDYFLMDFHEAIEGFYKKCR